MNIRQAVVFAIFMQHGEGILQKHPSYLKEKLVICETLNVPEIVLDAEGRALFNSYGKRFKFKWDTKRDYMEVPHDKFDTKTGEALI